MLPAGRRTNAEKLLELVDAARQIRCGVDEVIDYHARRFAAASQYWNSLW